jgi:hypothetical protein
MLYKNIEAGSERPRPRAWGENTRTKYNQAYFKIVCNRQPKTIVADQDQKTVSQTVTPTVFLDHAF